MLTKEETVSTLAVDYEKGLTQREARRRYELVGPNRLAEQKRITPLALFFSQFTDFMVLVLIAATLLSGLMGEYADAATIIAIIIINAFLGFFQEYRAERSLAALKKMVAPEGKVVREGKLSKIPAEEIVPGDVVVLESGDIVPADLRVLQCNRLKISEAALTGESFPVEKRADETYREKTTLGDRMNICYMGTVVTGGKGQGVVVATGMQTEMGQIAGYMQDIKQEDTPLQKRLGQLGRCLVLFCLGIVGAVVAVGILHGEETYKMVLTGVSLAVAAIPEGLPAIVTVALAVGVQRMVKREAIVRELPAVETLGCATVICSDKTGTLTQNEMTIRSLYLAGENIKVEGEGYEPHGRIIYPNKKGWLTENKEILERVSKVAALCNNAVLQKDTVKVGGLFRKNGRSPWGICGDPTEGAFLVFAAKAGIWKEVLEKKEKRVWEIPFSSERKIMSVVYAGKDEKGYMVYCKGAPAAVLDRCSKIYWRGRVVALTAEIRKDVLKATDNMASQALRVLGMACREITGGFRPEKEDELERELTFLGMAGMIDPPRTAAKKAISACRGAGIKIVMITGDHRNTAEAVAKELKIMTGAGQEVLTGVEMDEMSDSYLQRVVNSVAVYARVTPQHKIRIVRALKKAGHVVAMTGDGVNDAPAVKEADIGICMGITGTDVTKEASSLILGDDDFSTIVAAIEEGRVIYDNIRKFIRYLLSCNMGEVMTMFVAVLLGFPLPLIPIQILWMNLVTDGLPAIALGLDPGEPDVMKKRPRKPQESIFAHGLPAKIIGRGAAIAATVLLAYTAVYYFSGGIMELSRTMAFTTLVFAQLFYVFECRSERYSVFELGLFSNPFLVAAVISSILMQLVVIYTPFFQRVFGTVPLGLGHWFVIIGFAMGTFLLQGLYRTVKIRRKRRVIYVKI